MEQERVSEVENPVVTGVGLPNDEQLSEVALTCDLCKGEIYEGDEYVNYLGDIFCSSHHLGEYLIKQGLAESCIVGKKIFH